MKRISFLDIKNNKEISKYIKNADIVLDELGYTNHSFLHVEKCAQVSKRILETLGYSAKEIELAQIAAYMHDIGNSINRDNHAQSGALMAFNILSKLKMDPDDISIIISAIGNHDEKNGIPVNAVTASIILADKTDVHKDRVRSPSTINEDIHDRVNYAVEESDLIIDKEKQYITLSIKLDTEITPIMDYFEIFSERMIMSKLAANKLNCTFKLIINNQVLI